MAIHAYPTISVKLRNNTGNNVPPMDDVKATTPKAVPRLFLNQCAMMLITGPNTMPHDTYEPHQLVMGG
jgi:hypothetical protein